VKALIGLHGEMEQKFVKIQKKKKVGFLVFTMCFSSCSFEF
jgi:hypothetical protein